VKYGYCSSRQNGRVGMVALAVWMIALDGIVAVERIVAVGTLMLTFTHFESSSLIISGYEYLRA
jgi:hypothetical protein